jgi:acetylornithine deacetylase
MKKESIQAAVKKNLPAATALLMALIRVPSVRGKEKAVSRALKKHMAGLADRAELDPLPDSLQDDPDYSFRLEGFTYRGTANLRLLVEGDGTGEALAFNTHLDVVPPAEGQEDAFSPILRKGRVYGRGACDAKGQAVALWIVLKTLRDLGLKPRGDLILDFVAEEECGGNGTLRVVRRGLRASAAVVLEPTDLQVVNLVRGAVWFEVRTSGVSGHSGSPGSTRSALKEAILVMEAIENVRAALLKRSVRAIPSLAGHPNPMPCTFGILRSGNWPAATPDHGVLKGVFGFLGPYSREDVQARLRAAVSPYRAEVLFNMLNNDPSWIPEEHRLVRRFLQASSAHGLPDRPGFMNASCDAWRYTVQLGIPAVVFGPGSLSSAHSARESVAVADLGRAAAVLLEFIDRWSGFTHAH